MGNRILNAKSIGSVDAQPGQSLRTETGKAEVRLIPGDVSAFWGRQLGQNDLLIVCSGFRSRRHQVGARCAPAKFVPNLPDSHESRLGDFRNARSTPTQNIQSSDGNPDAGKKTNSSD